jgi:serine/threonine protein kinase
MQPTSAWVTDFQMMRELRVLSEDAFRTVKLVEDPLKGDLVALKSFNLGTKMSPDTSANFFREIETLVRLPHPCLIPIVGYYLQTPTSPPQIAAKFAVNGSLRDALCKRQSGIESQLLDETGIAIIVCGIVAEMRFLHANNVMHRDLKLENILLDQHGSPKIGDLGSSNFTNLNLSMTPNVGTPMYMAPEMYKSADYTASVDVYSFSLILYEPLVGRHVFPGVTGIDELLRTIEKGDRPTLPELMDETVKTIISRGWSQNPDDRDSFAAIFESLQGIHFKLTPGVDPDRVAGFLSSISGDMAAPPCAVPSLEQPHPFPESSDHQTILPSRPRPESKRRRALRRAPRRYSLPRGIALRVRATDPALVPIVPPAELSNRQPPRPVRPRPPPKQAPVPRFQIFFSSTSSDEESDLSGRQIRASVNHPDASAEPADSRSRPMVSPERPIPISTPSNDDSPPLPAPQLLTSTDPQCPIAMSPVPFLEPERHDVERVPGEREQCAVNDSPRRAGDAEQKRP